MQRDPAAGDRGGAGAAIGLDHVAIEGDLLLAQRLQIDHGAQRAADQPLDFQRASALLAGGGFAADALPVARGSMPYSAVTQPRAGLEPARHLLFQAGRAEHMGVAELHQAGALGVFDTLRSNEIARICLGAGRPHR